MKTTLLAAAILIGSSCAAQIGVVTMNRNTKVVPVGHWYNFHIRSWKNTIAFYAPTAEVLEELNEILEDNALFFEEHQKDEEGNKYWEIENENGFISTIYLEPEEEDGWSRMTIYASHSELK